MTRGKIRPHFSKRPDAVSLAVVVGHIGFVLAPVYIAALWNPRFHLVFLWLWFGLTAHGLTNLMHECAHWHVFKSRQGSDLLGRWILGPLFVADFDGYRYRHWEHHRHLGEDIDPKYSYLESIRGWRLLHFCLRCLFLVEAVRKFFHQTQGSGRSDSSGAASSLWMARVLLVQAFFFGSLFATSYWLGSREPSEALVGALGAYFVVYVYGLMSLTLFTATLRAIAEHKPSTESAFVVGRACVRNLSCTPLSRLLLGCYGFAEHATHHQEPAIPYYNLPQATEEIATSDPAFTPQRGYASTLFELVRPEPHQS